MINDIQVILEIYDRAIKNGKKEGDSCQEEFNQLLKEKPEAFTFLGTCEEDADLLAGNLREKGLKILNINEIGKSKRNKNS
jgi:hypothetical protein